MGLFTEDDIDNNAEYTEIQDDVESLTPVRKVKLTKKVQRQTRRK